MVPLLISSDAPSSRLGPALSWPPGLMVIRPPAPLTKLEEVLVTLPRSLMVMMPSFSNACVLKALLTVIFPAGVLKPPSQVRGAELRRLPALVKLVSVVACDWAMLLPLSAVTPLNDERALI